MENLLKYLVPENIGLWVGVFTTLILVSYLMVWVATLILCRLPLPRAASSILRVYLSWSLTLTIHAVGVTAFFVFLGQFYREISVPPWYLVTLIVPIVFDGIIVMLSLSHRINQRYATETSQRIWRETKQPPAKAGGFV